LGAALAALGRTQEALPHLQEAIRLKPDLEAAHATLGTALANLGRFDEAIAQLSEAVRLNPKDAEARVNLEKALERKTQEQRK
jgi:Flp pilus assembly protein TadD